MLSSNAYHRGDPNQRVLLFANILPSTRRQRRRGEDFQNYPSMHKPRAPFCFNVLCKSPPIFPLYVHACLDTLILVIPMALQRIEGQRCLSPVALITRISISALDKVIYY